MFGKSVKRYLPAPEKVANNRWLRWLGPKLTQPSLWQANRRTIALGCAIGVFMGLLIPLAQIPAAALLAVILRANLPMAMVSTLVTNPFTFAPVYFLAYKLGNLVLSLGESDLSDEAIDQRLAAVTEGVDSLSWFDHIGNVGAPLFTGLFIIATVTSVALYFGISFLWRLGVVFRQRKRRKLRNGESA